MKFCKDCCQELPSESFWKRAGGDGLQAYCKPCMGVRNTAWRKANIEKSRGHVKAWADKNREHLSKTAKARYDADPAASRAKALAVYRRRKPKIAEYARRRRATVPAVWLRGRISAQIREFMASGKGGHSAADLVGYSMAELRAHLERQFTKGMSWDNAGDWHIDHIVPLSAFAIAGPHDPELRRAWALPNLRPLWAKENIAKGAKRVSLL